MLTIITKQLPDGGVKVYVPNEPTLQAYGDTREEAIGKMIIENPEQFRVKFVGD